MQRIHEKLVEEEGIPVGYSTLTRMLRELGLSRQPATSVVIAFPTNRAPRCSMTRRSIRCVLAGQRTKLIASLLYLRYSKRRYLKFYRVFNRFTMKCFLHEALMFWGYAAGDASSTTRTWLG